MRRLARRGLTLIEVVVTIAVVLGLVAVVSVSARDLFQMEQHRAAKELAMRYELLHDEAVLRNMTFRLAFHLDGGYYQIEAGDASTLIFSDPDKRREYEEETIAKRRKFTKRELSEGAIKEENPFQTVADTFKTKIQLPAGTAFAGVQTPQYDKMIEPSGSGEEDPDEPLVVYSYIFANGFVEPTLIQLVSTENDEEGYTVVVEPLSGQVKVHAQLLSLDDLDRDTPEQGPGLNN